MIGPEVLARDLIWGADAIMHGLVIDHLPEHHSINAPDEMLLWK